MEPMAQCRRVLGLVNRKTNRTAASLRDEFETACFEESLRNDNGFRPADRSLSADPNIPSAVRGEPRNPSGIREVMHLKAKREGLMLSLGGDVVVIEMNQ